VIVPADYAHWRASPIGALTERLEQKVVFELSGDLHGRRGLDLGCGDGTYSILACQRGARSSVYYPPVRPVAQALGVHDRILSCLGQFGASFLAVRADKA